MAERVRELGALRSLRSKKKLVEEERLKTHFASNEDNEKWIEDFVERETAMARK
jgi:DNA-binding ferritin-like protein